MNFAKKLNEKFKIVLASASPRRRELMELAGLEFDVWPSNGEEDIRSSVPGDICVELSRQKALDVASQIRTYNEQHRDLTSPADILVIGADTVVAFDGVVFGKPKDADDAAKMLRTLSGNTHIVYTGVTFVFMSSTGRAGEYTFCDETKVTFYDLDEDDIEAYIATGDPFDKAGSYGVQTGSATFVRSMEGDFYNVMGLPIARLLAELKGIMRIGDGS